MKNKSKFFWVYSIALFSVAFILIGFSAFTGVRYQQSQTEVKNLYQGAQASIEELQNTLEELKKDNAELRETVDTLEAEAEKNAETVSRAQAAQALLRVQVLVNEKKWNDAKDVYGIIDTTLLTEDGLVLYEELGKVLN